MRRFLYTIILFCGIAVSMFADPIKKGTPVDTAKINKITKECADGFIKAMMTDKAGDALKLCDTPFRRYDGTKLESLESVKKVFDQPPPPGIEVRTGEPIELSKFNEYLIANKFTELDSDTIKEYENYIGKNGRILILEQTNIGRAFARPLGDKPPRHMLNRVSNDKAHFVGVGGR